MVQLFQAFDFPEDVAILPGLVLALHFFDGDDLVIGIHGLEDHPVGAVADRLHYLILLHNYQL